jgi:hypothetical protein
MTRNGRRSTASQEIKMTSFHSYDHDPDRKSLEQHVGQAVDLAISWYFLASLIGVVIFSAVYAVLY